MAVTAVRIRRRAVGGSAGAPASLKTAELAYNMQDGVIYIGYGDDGGGNATSVKAIAKDNFVDPSGVYQPLDADLTAIAAFDATTGIVARTGAGAFTRRTITGTATRVAVTNGDGASGNPTIDLATLTVGGSVAGGSTKFTYDTYGRITNAGQATHSDIAAPTADVGWGGYKITSLADPVSGTDAATKQYVDNAMFGLDAKASVRVASTANQALSGGTAFPTIDGVVTAANDRVLLKNQTTTSQNGIYVVGGTATAWTLSRAADMDSWAEVPGAMITIEEGSTLADSVWIGTANQGGTLGSTAIAFTRIDAGAGGGFTIAGNGLTSAGSTIDVAPGTGISVAGDVVGLTGQALALHNVSTAADQLIYATGVSTFAATGLSSYIRTLLDDVDAATARGTLGLGSMATQSASAVAITGGTIDGVTIDGGTF
jgi:hypothetical protein